MHTTADDDDYWYTNRHALQPGMTFRDRQGDLVQLDRRVPGDGTQWYALVWCNNHWSCEDHTIEPGDLTGQPLPDPARA